MQPPGSGAGLHLDATLVEPDTALPHCEGGLGTEQAGNRIGIEVISKELSDAAVRSSSGMASPLNGAAYHEVERTARRGMRSAWQGQAARKGYLRKAAGLLLFVIPRKRESHAA